MVNHLTSDDYPGHALPLHTESGAARNHTYSSMQLYALQALRAYQHAKDHVHIWHIQVDGAFLF